MLEEESRSPGDHAACQGRVHCARRLPPRGLTRAGKRQEGVDQLLEHHLHLLTATASGCQEGWLSSSADWLYQKLHQELQPWSPPPPNICQAPITWSPPQASQSKPSSPVSPPCPTLLTSQSTSTLAWLSLTRLRVWIPNLQNLIVKLCIRILRLRITFPFRCCSFALLFR